MIVRKLRVRPATTKPEITQDIDAVQDPIMLAHRLMQLDVTARTCKFDAKLRVSSLHRICPRAQVLCLRRNMSNREMLSAGMRVTFDIGNAIHLFLQSRGGYFGSNLLGWWRCPTCSSKIFGRKPTTNCVQCGTSCREAVYVEHSLKLPASIPVSGHMDGFLEVAPGDIRVIDFKTVNGEDFDTMYAPKPEHCIQVNGYMHYAQMDATLPVNVNADKGLILYVSKKHVHKSLPFKMFHIHRDATIVENIIEAKVGEFRQALDSQTYLPPLALTCQQTGFKSAQAKDCLVRSFCMAANSQ